MGLFYYKEEDIFIRGDFVTTLPSPLARRHDSLTSPG